MKIFEVYFSGRKKKEDIHRMNQAAGAKSAKRTKRLSYSLNDALSRALTAERERKKGLINDSPRLGSFLHFSKQKMVENDEYVENNTIYDESIPNTGAGHDRQKRNGN